MSIVSKDGSITPDILSKGLRRIGKHPITLRHGYLELCLSESHLDNIDHLKNFPYIMFLDISGNSIESLDVLQNMTTLVKLNASGNAISECLAFSAPLCHSENAWTEGYNSAGSLLTDVDLSENEIKEILDLSAHRFLEVLKVASNQIRSINGLNNLSHLRELDLSYNSISVIEGLDNLPIQVLNLRGNAIMHLHGLDTLPHLTSLDVAENKICSLAPLWCLKNLVHLDAGSNEIDYIRQTEFLQEIPWLQTLVLAKNPGQDKELYRLRVLFRLPRLAELDGEAATQEDKVRAFNLYHSSLGDMAMRESVLAKHVPTVPFVDYSPQQLPHDEENDVTPRDLSRGISVRPAAHAIASNMFDSIIKNELG